MFSSSLGFSQVEINPSALEFVTSGSEDQVAMDFFITNNTGADLNGYWVFEPAEDFPSEWTAQICDIELCYGFGTYASSSINPNFIEAGAEVKFSIKVRRNDFGIMDGTSFGIFRLYDDADKTNEVGATASPVVSTSEVDLNDLVLYPNPATDNFRIKNDSKVASLSIFNLIGKQIKSYIHTAGASHSISDLSSGIYSVTLEDEDGHIIKSMRLSKR